MSVVDVVGCGKLASETAEIDGSPHAVMRSNQGKGVGLMLSAKPCEVRYRRIWMPMEEIWGESAE